MWGVAAVACRLCCSCSCRLCCRVALEVPPFPAGPDGGGGPGAANGSLGVAEAVHLSVLRAAEAQDPQLGAALRELATEGAEEDRSLVPLGPQRATVRPPGFRQTLMYEKSNKVRGLKKKLPACHPVEIRV